MGGEVPGAEGGGLALPADAVAAAEAVGAAVREVAASLPFGVDPGAFAAALERLGGDDGIEEALP